MTVQNRIFNTLNLQKNWCHFTDDIVKCIFFNENVWIPFEISLKFVPKGQINNIPSLVQIMAWCRPGSKPLFEPIIASWVEKNTNDIILRVTCVWDQHSILIPRCKIYIRPGCHKLISRAWIRNLVPQQIWYWLCKIYGLLLSLKNDF